MQGRAGATRFRRPSFPRLPQNVIERRLPGHRGLYKIGRLKRAGFSSPILLISATSSSVSEMTLKFDSMRDGVTDLGMTAEGRNARGQHQYSI